ncbi:uncharacterized protein LOC133835134 [Drosophila sulfurigaster albostrigata]|uniref:uncharacterized protein LOC133835134 n=1 Tax=Drosophila sulfurigaster albostrigata TaxID=89887 RepID=UPI002D218514|nr:uncharacterized protein LOC133835134 [Drosophila sulfurigaster albostrigata]
MFRFLIVIWFILLPSALLQTENPYICEETVTVEYTARERLPVEAYGSFAESFRKYGIQGAMQDVLKTRLEVHKVCCPGYEDTNPLNLSCQAISTTTTESSDFYDETTTINELFQSFTREQTGFDQWVIICGALLVATAFVALTLLTWHYIKQKRLRRAMEGNDVGNELDARTALFAET